MLQKVKRMCLCHGVVHSSAYGEYGRLWYNDVVRVFDVRLFSGFPALGAIAPYGA
jgi:hypothetical protein